MKAYKSSSGLYTNPMKMNSRIFSILLSLSFCFCLLNAGAAKEEEPRILSFTPQGKVKEIRQVQVRFSESMVAFGDPGAQSPFQVECLEEGNPRWVDTNHWVYDFRRDLPAGIQCRFALIDGIQTLNGKEIAGKRSFEFSTGGPSVLQSNPWEGSEFISEDQIFILELDGVVDKYSVEENVHFLVEGVANRIPVEIIPKSEGEEILNNDYRYRSHEDLREHFLLLRAKQTFPVDKRINLVWDQGVKSENGVPTDEVQVLRFKTRSGFTARLHCQRENQDTNCIPLTPIRLIFSAPVQVENARQIRLTGPEGRVWAPDLSSRDEDYIQDITFQGPFPPESQLRMEVPPTLLDDAGRPLLNADRFPLEFRIDGYPPLAKFSADFGILEAEADPLLPVTLRNLEAQIPLSVMEVQGAPVKASIHRIDPTDATHIQNWLRTIQQRKWADRERSVFKNQIIQPEERFLPKPNGEKAFEVVGIPLDNPGFYIVELKSEILGRSLLQKPVPMYVSTSALVTNMAVHLKWGMESSLVWVTQLDQGIPVADAEVEIFDCQGQPIWNGVTNRDGVALPESLPGTDDVARCEWSEMGGGLFVIARKENDVSFVHSDWQEGIEAWRFQVPREWDSDQIMAHTVFDRPLFRAGETVHMKSFLRLRTTRGFDLPPEKQRPKTMAVIHQGSYQSYEYPVEWDDAGISVKDWVIPKEANLGLYQIVFSSEDFRNWTGGSFRVEEFRVPLMKGNIHAPKEPLINPSEVRIGFSAEFLTGTKASRLPVKLRYQIQPGYLPASEFLEGFRFVGEKVSEGITRSGYMDQRIEEREIFSEDAVLNPDGWAEFDLEGPGQVESVKEMQVEVEFRDPNGQIQTSAGRITLYPSHHLVGIKARPWTPDSKEVELQIAVVDLFGKRVPGAQVSVEVLQRKTYSHRKRLVGGFYSYEHFEEVEPQGEFCRGVTDQDGFVECRREPGFSGNLILQASTEDSDGNRTFTNIDVWVHGEDEWWFKAEDHDRIDLLPDQKRYEPGDKARIQVQMPFRDAIALVTTEREGVGDYFIQPLTGKNPVFELPIDESYSPNVFVSVLVIRGRVSGTQPTALVDLGRPAYKLGLTELEVGWKNNQIRVEVSSDRAVYHVRETAEIEIRAVMADGSLPPPGTELALAAVDEGLLQLQPNESWNLLEAMMGRRGLGVETSTAQMQVVGKRHFGLKALPQGGGGGRQSTRELFDTLLYWNPKIRLDPQGVGKVSIPLNDSVTSFRCAAIASSGLDRFGMGEGRIRTVQDLVIFSGIAPVAREGDRVHSEFTVLNATESEIQVTIQAEIQEIEKKLNRQQVKLSPSQSTLIGWDVDIPVGRDRLTYQVEAVSSSGSRDRIKVNQKIIPLTPVRTYQSDLEQLEGLIEIPVQKPSGALQGRGGIQIEFRPTLLNTLDGIQEYMSAYPYTCLEQEISKSIALTDRTRWDFLMDILPAYMDSNGLLRYFPNRFPGSTTLTSYVLAIGSEAGWEIPNDVREKMLDGLNEFVNGNESEFSVINVADRTLRKLIAIEALTRYRRVQPEVLSSLELLPNLWPTSSLIDYVNILTRLIENWKDSVIRYPSGNKGISAALSESVQVLDSRLNLQGTQLQFSTERIDRVSWLMVSPDLNAVRLILSRIEGKRGEDGLPRLMKAALGRQHNGHWDLTTANAWGTLALEKFSNHFESDSVSGVTKAALTKEEKKLDWLAHSEGGSFEFPWPNRPERLNIQHEGDGKPWVLLQGRAAIPLTEKLESGYSIRRTVSPVEQKNKGKWSIGDIYRVHLEISAQSDQTWVVVSDPIPSGAMILGTGLGGETGIAAEGENQNGVQPIFLERSFEAFRAYYRFVPKGTWSIEYTVRLNSSGRLNLPPTRVEAMYAPEIFGEAPAEKMDVGK